MIKRLRLAPLNRYAPCLLLRLALLAAAVPAGVGCTPSTKGATNDLTDTEKREAIERMYSEHRGDFPGAREVRVEELIQLRETTDVVLVDVRELEERAVAVIPGSLSKAEYEQRRDTFAGRTVVAYCTIGYRSGQYAQALREENIKAYNLVGSILAWVHAGQPVVDPEGNETKRVHVYGSTWDLLPEGYEGVW